MRAAQVFGPGDVRVVEVDEPSSGPGQVKIEIAYAGICGTDLMIYTSAPVPPTSRHPLFGEPGPHTLGHEFCGWVREVGDGVDTVQVGDLVTVAPTVDDGECPACLRGEPNLCEKLGFIGVHGGGGGFSEFVVAAADKIFPLPESFTPQTGALVECLAVAWHAARIARAEDARSALVTGAGPVGLALVLALRAHGVSDIFVREPAEARSRQAKALNATLVRDGLDAGPTVDIAFDAAGVGVASFGPTLAAVRPGGSAIVVAHFHDDVAINLSHLMISEITVRGSIAYTRRDFEEVIAAIAAGRLDPAPLVTRQIALDDLVERGLEHLQSPAGRAHDIKVLVSPSREQACVSTPAANPGVGERD